MKKLIFTAALLAGAAFGLKSQIHYKTIEDDPYAIRKLMIHLDPFYCDLYGTNITMGWGGRVDLHYGSLGTLNLDVRVPYLDMVQSDNKGNKDIKKALWLEGVASINLSDKTKQRDLKIILSQSSHTVGNTTYTNTKYFMAPGTVRKIFGVRGGVYYMNTGYKAADGTVKAYAEPNTADTLWATGDAMMKTMTFVGGVSFKSITNLLVSVSDWGTRRNSGFSDVYIDVLFAPAVGLGDANVASTSSGAAATMQDLKVENVKNIGWRFGWAYKNPMRSWLTYKMEFGSRPGYKNDTDKFFTHNAFYMFTCGISIPFKTKGI